MNIEQVLISCNDVDTYKNDDTELPFEEWVAVRNNVTFLQERRILSNPFRAKKIADFLSTINGAKMLSVTNAHFGEMLVELIPNSEFLRLSSRTRLANHLEYLFKSNGTAIVLDTLLKYGYSPVAKSHPSNFVIVDSGKMIDFTLNSIQAVERFTSVNVYDIYADSKYSVTHAEHRRVYYQHLLGERNGLQCTAVEQQLLRA